MLGSYFSVIQKHPKILTFGVVAAFFSNFGQTFFFGLYAQYFLIEFSLTNTQFGSIYSGVTLMSAIALFVLGHLIDKVSLPLYSAVVCLFLSVGCFFIFQSQHIMYFIVGLWLVRFLGQGVLSHMASTVTARYIRNGRGKALSLMTLGFPFGEICFPVMVVFLLGLFHWRETWLIYSFLYLLVALPVFVFLSLNRKTLLSSMPEKEIIKDKSLRVVLSDSIFWLVLVVSLLMPFLLTGLFFHHQWLMSNIGLSPKLFILGFIVFGAGRVFSSLVSGYFVDHYGAKRVMMVSLLPFAVFSLLFVVIPCAATLFLLLFCASFASGSLPPARGDFIAMRYGVSHLGAIKSIVSGSTVLSTALSPFIFGYLIDITNNGYLVFHISWVMAAIFTLMMLKLRNV